MSGRGPGSPTARSILSALLARLGLSDATVRGRGSAPAGPPAAPSGADHDVGNDHSGMGPGLPYVGDYTGPLQPTYDPHDDDVADPGEVVWGWVPYEDDPRRGKDRPVLIVGRDGDWLLALPVSSQDHDRDAAQEARAGRYWVDIGKGRWDPRGRASEARVNRVVRLAPHAVRRIGARLDRAVFDAVCAAMAAHG